MCEHVSFLCFIYLLFLHPSVLAWPTNNLLIALPASLPTILFQFEQTLHFRRSTLFFFFFFWAWTYLNMFLFHVLFILYSSVLVSYKKLSRAIHLYIFSRPAGAQLADCITFLATNHFVSVWADNCLSASSLVLYVYTLFSLNMSKHLSFLCFIHLLFLHSSVPP